MLPPPPTRHSLSRKLLDKSIDAYVLSLETINRLSTRYRVESFAYLICNSWELLLKARIIEDTGRKKSIFYPKCPNQPRRTLSLRDCIKRVFANDKDPVRRNVERVADLRDEVTHLILLAVPSELLALFQACVLNYHRMLGEWFSISLSDRVSVGMMTIVYDFDPRAFDITQPVLRRRLGAETATYLARLQSELLAEHTALGKSHQFSI